MNNADGNGGNGAAENAGDTSLNTEDNELDFYCDMFLNLEYDGKNNEGDGEQNSVEDCSQIFPSGYRFCPTDAELMNAYMKKKANKESLPPNNIHDENIYKYTPEQITEIYTPILGKENEKEWYFFTSRERKYYQGIRPNRAAGSGFWKATASDKKIYEDENDKKSTLLGTKKSLVFHDGRPPGGVKTNWIMHEYVLNTAEPRKRTSATDMTLDDYVLCRIKKRKTRSSQEKLNNESSTQPAETSASAAARQESANDENSVQPAETSSAAAAHQENANDENSVQPTETSDPPRHS